jgi:hypothetical protein
MARQAWQASPGQGSRRAALRCAVPHPLHPLPARCRPAEPLELQAGQSIVLTSDTSRAASSSCLPVSYRGLSALQPGTKIFVGQYLFTGSETTSAYLTVQGVEGQNVTCVCANSCVLEGVQLTVHVSGMNNQAPILADDDQAALAGGRWRGGVGAGGGWLMDQS